VSCYLRHLKKVINQAGVELAIRDIVGASGDMKCNEVWKVAREWLKQPEGENILISRLQNKIKKHAD